MCVEGDGKQLPKVMGWSDVALFTVSITIGSAIFRVPSEIAKYSGSTETMMLLWVAGLLISLAGAFVYLELAVRIPRSGANVVYLNTAFGPGTAFVFGWTTLLLSEPAAIAAVARTFADYAGAFIPLSEYQLRMTAATVIVLHTLAGMRSTRFATRFVSTAGAAKIAALVIVLAFSFGGPSAGSTASMTTPSTVSPLTGLVLALVGVIWAFDGHVASTLLTGEVRRPARNMPVGIILGTLVIAGLYMLLCAGFVRVLGFTGVQSSTAVASDAMGAVLGKNGLLMMSALVMGSTFATVGASLLGNSRSFFAMAQEGVFFRPFTYVHQRWRTPWLAVALLGGAATAMAFAGNFDFLIRIYVFVAYPFFALVAIGAIRLRRRHGPPHEYSMPFYPWPIVIFSGLIALLLILGAREDPSIAWFSPLIILIAAFAHRAWRPNKTDESGGSSHQH